MSQSYDAILIVSFGGPEGPDEVMPFMRNVLRGRNVPEERMREVAEHYSLYDGVSPINDQNRALIASLRAVLTSNGPRIPVYWGNRNWHPMLAETLQKMADDGVKRALAFITSGFSCYSGCRQYREHIQRAREQVGENAPVVDKIRVFYNHPGFVQPNIELTGAALREIPEGRRDAAHLAFCAHSIPMGMAKASSYVKQLSETARLVAQGLGHDDYKLVYQSRSGPPHVPWLEPDICDHLREVHAKGVKDVVISPIGFIADHMEVIYDLDTEARAVADELGLNMVRASTVGAHPTFIQMIRELILERMSDTPVRRVLGQYGPNHDVCPPNCCLDGRPAGRPGGRPGGRPSR